jgi:uncharacterized protein with von Willebrand factor type A (vWA) domain
MPDPRALVRVVDELLWSVRREGFVASTAQAIDVARAARTVGLESRAPLRDAVAAVLVDRRRDRRRFDRVFDAFFQANVAERGMLEERLRARGFTEDEVLVLQEILGRLASSRPDAIGPLRVLLEGGAELDRALTFAGLPRSADAASDLQAGFIVHAVLQKVGIGTARGSLALLRSALVEAFGPRGEALVDALARELDRAEDGARSAIRRRLQGDDADRDPHARRRAEITPFVALTGAEIDEVRRAVRHLAERLRGGARVRSRHAVRGRVDPHRTLRGALRTGGVPFRLERKRPRRDRPRLVLLCDVSDSVRAAATFLLEFTYAVHELFERTRSFVFVSDLGETTRLFATEPIGVAIARAWDGRIAGSGDNSNYGRVLRRFEAQHLRSLDRRTTVVILGDGRTNYHEPAPEVLDRIRERSRALLWLCPEPRAAWAQGDSAMPVYAPRCTSVLDVRCAADLERAARVLVARG